MGQTISVEDISGLFTRTDGTYLFARWGRSIAPIVFGVEDATLSLMKGAIEALCTLTGHHMAETDPELGINYMMFFFREWSELTEVPDLDRLVPDLSPLVSRLEAAEANQYRIFRFDTAGAIKACFIFVRMDKEMQKVSADTIALSQAVQSMLLWSDAAFQDKSPLGLLENGTAVLRPDISDILRVAYDPMLPVAADDASHALRIFARLSVQ